MRFAPVALLVMVAACSTAEKDGTSDELALLDQKLTQMSPQEACQELLEMCATTAKGCIAHDLFCTPTAPPPTLCQQLGDLCGQGSPTACQIFQSKCQSTSADGGPPPACGDQLCSPGESCKSCPKDCGACPKFDAGPVWTPDMLPPSKCGNKVCEYGESCKSCPTDCGSCPKFDGPPPFYPDMTPPMPKCGNKVCEYGESCKSCPTDCGYCPKSDYKVMWLG
jgi:hypothetical protein